MGQREGKKRILVTGGCGFLGSHLVDRLISKGNHVICADNLVSGTMRNTQHLKDNPRYVFLNHDITEPLDVDVDEIFNLASPASPLQYQRDPLHTAKTNVQGAMNMLDLARRLDCKILQASTSEVYGDPHVHPQSEDYWGNVNPIGPRACYDEGKRCAETLFSDYNRQHGLQTKIARIFNTYGPRMHFSDGRVVSNFIVQALEDREITVYGDGSQTRSFCFVGDLVEGLIRLMETDQAVTGPINLGNPNECSINELARQVITMTASNSRLSFRDLPVDDPKRRCPDIEKAKRILGWQPKVKIEQGLTETIRYFEKELSQATSGFPTAE